MRMLESNTSSQKNLFTKITACGFLIFLIFFRISNNVVDPDLWHQMALIREAIALGHIPLKDHFAYTPTVFPTIHHEWGAGVIAYLLATRLGASGILAAKYLLASIISIFSFLCLKRRPVSIEVLIFLIPIGILLIDEGFSTIRGQMYSLAFLSCLLWFFELDKNGTLKWIAAWLPLYQFGLICTLVFLLELAFSEPIGWNN